MTLHDFSLKTPQGENLELNQYKGQVVLIVNTATQCGLAPQFDGLEQLHQHYKDKGLVVLGTPCNQFSNQEPVKNEAMTETCRINHGVTFKLTEKIDVNGSQEHPVYKYLKAELGGFLGSKIKWNFTKFLIDKNGKPFKRYAPTTKPAKLEADIKGLLS
jgi:glutathione peroxidase